MATPEHTTPPSPDASALPPAAADLVNTTDWAALKHGLGPTTNCPPYYGETVADIPDLLRALLHPDARTAARALDTITSYASDEEGDLTILSFVPAVARFTSAVLNDPRTLRRTPSPWGPPGTDQALPTRLLALLADVAAEATWHELNPGNPPHPPTAARAEFLALRPALYAAVACHLDAPDPDARENAVLAALMLARHPDPAAHRGYLVARTRVVLTEDDFRAYTFRQATACYAIRDWGYRTLGLIPDPVEWIVDGYPEDPPF